MPPFVSNDSMVLAPVPGTPARVHIAYTQGSSAVYMSDDYGAAPAFQARHERDFDRHRLAASADGVTLYGGWPTGGLLPLLHRYQDGGATRDVMAGPYHADVHTVVTTASPPYVYIGTDGGLWRYHETLETWENLNGDMANLMVYHAATAHTDTGAIVAGTQDNGAIVSRGGDWVVAVGSDAWNSFLRTDDPSLGGSFQGGTANQIIYIDGMTGRSPGTPPEPPPCWPPEHGRYALDPDNPRRVCIADGSIFCAVDSRHEQWCDETTDQGFGEVVMVGGNHAWARATGGRILRTTTGLFGSWMDVSSGLPDGSVIGLAAPEGGSPLRALVMIRLTGGASSVYETTDGGTSWTARGVPPVPDEKGPALSCSGPPCPDEPEPGPRVFSFGVRFPRTLVLETWYAGTWSGLLQSQDAGATWQDAGLPHVQIRDVNIHANIVTVATWGRGVYQSIAETRVPEFDFLAIEPFWMTRHLPYDLDRPWASDLMADSNEEIQEIRGLQGGGRAFRRGDTPQGLHDFHLIAGQPFIMQGDAGASPVPVQGLPGVPGPVFLDPGWNAIGILDPAVQSASDLVADAAAQGIEIPVVMDGARQQVFVPGPQALAADFQLQPTEGYWVFACGSGGVFTPGAGMGDQSQASSAPGPPPPVQAAAAEQVCADPAAALSDMGAVLQSRLPGEIRACLPSQTVDVGNLEIPVCETTPVVESDLQVDNFACDDEPFAHGCAVIIRILGVEQSASDALKVRFDVISNGTAQTEQEVVCPVQATAQDGSFDVLLDVQIDPPLVHLSVLQTAIGVNVDQLGCGAAVDAAIAQLVAGAVQQALEQAVADHVAGLGPVCDPDFALPDGDGDGSADCVDGCPTDPAKADPGACGCGVVDDVDGDTVPWCTGDCNDEDPAIWNSPGETGTVQLGHDPQTGQTTATWLPPSSPGATAVVYDVIASPDPANFLQTAFCIESDDGADTLAPFSNLPDPGEALFIVIRAENSCPNGLGNLGQNTNGEERQGRLCP
jgi:photosystem II stability/assembly factor-like uncharacterized protein